MENNIEEAFFILKLIHKQAAQICVCAIVVVVVVDDVISICLAKIQKKKK